MATETIQVETQLHVTLLENALVPEAVPPFRHGESWNKPRGGFWTSTWLGDGSDWTRWCEDNDWATPESQWRGFLLTPKADAKILVIDSLADMEALPWAKRGTFLEVVDWASVFRVFDAVHLTERGQRVTHLHRPGHDLYGWDAESTVWARWAFTACEPVLFPVKRPVAVVAAGDSEKGQGEDE